MKRDPVVEEVRKAREAYTAQFDHNLDRIVEDLQRRQDGGEFQVIRRPPRRPRKVSRSPARKRQVA
jgi:hypothetical protein